MLEELATFLENVLERVRVKLLYEWKRDGSLVGFNVKGDETRSFDLMAEEFLINEIRKRYPEAAFFAEEEGEIGGEGPFFIIDPVDGSTNFFRKVGSCSVSVAVADEPYLDRVKVGVVKSIFSGDVYIGIKGRGAFLNGEHIRSSNVKEVGDAIIGVDLDFPDKSNLKRLLPLLMQAKKLRKIGSNALEVSYVAHGGYDAFIDIRNVLTCESFLAAKIILEEAGGILTNEKGEKVKGKVDLAQKWSIIAAGNKELHSKICEILNEVWHT